MKRNDMNFASGMSVAEMKAFIENHFEEFVNRKNLDVADVNFAADFVDHGTECHRVRRPGPQERNSMWEMP